MPNQASWVAAMPEIYDRHLGPALFEPYAAHLGAMAATLAPQDVLELAAGTGILTEQLLERLPAARITATDLNAAMVGRGQARAPGAHWRQADALQLDFAAAAFDLVVCQFGVMFFPDKVAGFAEAARVIRPDGHLLFAVWDELATSPLTAAVQDSVATVLDEDPPTFIQRLPHGYHDPEPIAADVAAGGLRVRTLERVVLPCRSTARDLARGLCLGSPLRFELEQRGDLDALVPLITAQVVARLGEGPVEDRMAAVVVLAQHP